MLCIKQIACGLTLTWDVLKYEAKCLALFEESRLTLTWDVLKSEEQCYRYVPGFD